MDVGSSGQPGSSLALLIADRIRREGAMRFRDFMELCLYHPQHGYYMRKKPVIGKEGDFYTSSSVGSLTGEMLAARFVRYWRDIRPRSFAIVEWGGGTGRLAGQILDELAANHMDVYEQVTYCIVDKSPLHRELHHMLDERHEGRWTACGPEEWLSENEPLPGGTVIFSNELLDAFPVHRVRFDGGAFLEQYVEPDGRNGFAPVWRSIREEDPLAAWLRGSGLDGRLLPGQQLEVNLEAEAWLARVAGRLDAGLLVTIDYGDTEERLYAAERYEGTLMCYRQHTAHDNPFIHVGEQDITAFVNFSALMRTGEKHGLRAVSCETQREFLLNGGILERLQEHTVSDPFHPVVRRNRAIRQLLVGDRMGDVFKVLVQQKDGRA